MLQPRPGSWRTKPKSTTPIPQSWPSPVPKRQKSPADMVVYDDITQLDLDGELRHADALAKHRPQTRSKFEVEQLLRAPGKLRKPMSSAERERVIRKLLPTVTHKMLAAIRPELIEADGIEGQTLRRRLVKDATVVFFTAGYPGKRFVFERAFELGIKSVVIEHPDSWAKGLVEEGIIAKFIPVNMGQSSEEIFEQSLELIKGLGADGVTGEADAICTFVELSVPLVARLCEVLGLPGNLPSAVDAARDKHATRAALKAAGLPTPRNLMIHSEADLEAAAQHVGFPAVLKPISGAASLGVKKVVQASDLLPIYREVVNELKSLVVLSGAIAQNDGSGQGVAAGDVIALSMLLEQFLDGNEVDIDMVVSEGEWRYVGITDNGPTLEPYFNETWGVCPSLLPLDKQRELKDLAVASVKALNLAGGVFHVECKYTSTGPQLIEVNARMGGGPVHEINLRCWGVDLVEEAIFVAMGIPARPVVPEEPLVSIGHYMVPSQHSGRIQELPNLDAVLQRDDVVWARPLCKVGEQVVGPADGLPTWIFDLMVMRPTARDALDAVMKLEEENKLKLA